MAKPIPPMSLGPGMGPVPVAMPMPGPPPGEFPSSGAEVGEAPATAPALDIQPPPAPAPEEPISGGQMFTDSQVSYHGPQEVCGSCDYFQPPGECIVVQGPKDESGWCVLHSARAPSAPMGEAE